MTRACYCVLMSFTKVSKGIKMCENELNNMDWGTTTFITSTTHPDGCTIFRRRDRLLA